MGINGPPSTFWARKTFGPHFSLYVLIQGGQVRQASYPAASAILRAQKIIQPNELTLPKFENSGKGREFILTPLKNAFQTHRS